MLHQLIVALACCQVLFARKLIKELSLEKPFINHEFHNQNFDTGGQAVLSRTRVRLTGDHSDQRGFIVNYRDLLPSNFELVLSFRIEGSSRSLFGDGMAIWFLDQSSKIAEGGVFGLKDYWNGSVVAIDTYRNHRPGRVFPLVQIMTNDGTKKYDNDNDGLANELDSCSVAGLHNAAQEIAILKIRSTGGYLSVALEYRGRWQECFKHKLELPSNARLVLSASTGQLSEAHIIHGLHVYELDSGEREVPPVEIKASVGFGGFVSSVFGYIWFLAKVAIVVAIVYLLYIKLRKRRGAGNDYYLG